MAEMEERRAYAQQTGLLISKHILEHSHVITKEDTEDSRPVQSVLVKSFEQAQQRCSTIWTEVTNWLQEILEHHIPAGQVGVFLAVLYQVMCTQQEGITLMLMAQARLPVHLCINNWPTQVSLTRLIAQVIPGLGSLTN